MCLCVCVCACVKLGHMKEFQKCRLKQTIKSVGCSNPRR